MMLQHSKVPMFKMNPFYSAQLCASGWKCENREKKGRQNEKEERYKKLVEYGNKRQTDRQTDSDHDDFPPLVAWCFECSRKIEISIKSHRMELGLHQTKSMTLILFFTAKIQRSIPWKKVIHRNYQVKLCAYVRNIRYF